MSWGVEPVRRDQQGKSTIRMRGVYVVVREIASDRNWHDARSIGEWREFAGFDAVGAKIPTILQEEFPKILFLLRRLTLLE
jgi:hypothetical protein